MLCVSLGKVSPEKIKEVADKSELVELRLDLNDFSLKEIKEIFGSSDNLIATFRSGKSDSERKSSIMTAIESGAKFVDLDLSTDKTILADLISETANKSCQTILSYHNYETTPSKRNLELIRKDLFDSGADIGKIACMVNSVKDINTLLSLYGGERNLISVGMGAKGRITRVASHFLGSPIVYASYDNDRTAPGQIAYGELKRIIKTIENG